MNSMCDDILTMRIGLRFHVFLSEEFFLCVCVFLTFYQTKEQKSSVFSLADKGRLYKQFKKVSEEVSSSILSTLAPKYH